MTDTRPYADRSWDLHQRCTATSAAVRNKAFEDLRRQLTAVARKRADGDTYLEQHVEDCVQEALFVISLKLDPKTPADASGRLMAPESFLGWCFQIGINEVEQVRRQLNPAGDRPKRVPRRLLASLEAPIGDEEGESTLGDRLIAPEGEEPEQVSRITAIMTFALRSLKCVSDRSSAILFQEGYDGLEDAEIAVGLNISTTQVQRTRYSNRKKLHTQHPDLVAQARELCG